MGPYSLKWYNDNNVSYNDIHMGGRIDCNNGGYKKAELEWPIMDIQTASNFITWLSTFKSKTLLTYQELKEKYELETKTKLKEFY